MQGGWKRFFPAAHHGPLAGVGEWAGLAHERLGNEPLDAAGPYQPLVIRLLCLPTWAPACSVRTELVASAWRIGWRELDGEAGFELGKLARHGARVLTAVEVEQVVALWAYLRFWSQPTVVSNGSDVLDGTAYLLEAVEQGRYHAVLACDPEWGTTFGELAEMLLRMAGITRRAN